MVHGVALARTNERLIAMVSGRKKDGEMFLVPSKGSDLHLLICVLLGGNDAEHGLSDRLGGLTAATTQKAARQTTVREEKLQNRVQ
jgi:hypothetical protein